MPSNGFPIGGELVEQFVAMAFLAIVPIEGWGLPATTFGRPTEYFLYSSVDRPSQLGICTGAKRDRRVQGCAVFEIRIYRADARSRHAALHVVPDARCRSDGYQGDRNIARMQSTATHSGRTGG